MRSLLPWTLSKQCLMFVGTYVQTNTIVRMHAEPKHVARRGLFFTVYPALFSLSPLWAVEPRDKGTTVFNSIYQEFGLKVVVYLCWCKRPRQFKNISVLSGLFLGWISTKLGFKCLAKEVARTQRSASGKGLNPHLRSFRKINPRDVFRIYNIYNKSYVLST